MAETIGMFVSNEEKSVFSKDPRDLSFSAKFNMYKIKEERHVQNGQTLSKDHGLGYTPFFMGFIYSTSGLSGARQLDSNIQTMNNWSYTTRGYTFVTYNPGI